MAAKQNKGVGRGWHGHSVEHARVARMRRKNRSNY